MDDYFFIGKDLFDECKIIVNNDVPFENDLSILLGNLSFMESNSLKFKFSKVLNVRSLDLYHKILSKKILK
jgi:hypothetical protein